MWTTLIGPVVGVVVALVGTALFVTGAREATALRVVREAPAGALIHSHVPAGGSTAWVRFWFVAAAVVWAAAVFLALVL